MGEILEIVRHLPEHLQSWAQDYGPGLYGILAAIIFAETGLVVAPILPGDSLLFAAGAVLAMGLPQLSLPLMCAILIAAAFFGDFVNYHVGKWAKPRVAKLKWINPQYLHRTEDFYRRHGGRTLILARFAPIIRTYAPFVAGLSGMPLGRFVAFSLSGGFLWITSVTSLGYFFGNIEIVKKNFELVVLAIVAISFLPAAIEFLKARRAPDSSQSLRKN